MNLRNSNKLNLHGCISFTLISHNPVKYVGDLTLVLEVVIELHLDNALRMAPRLKAVRIRKNQLLLTITLVQETPPDGKSNCSSLFMKSMKLSLACHKL